MPALIALLIPFVFATGGSFTPCEPWATVNPAATGQDGGDDEPKTAKELLKDLKRGLKARRSSDEFERQDAIQLVVTSIDSLTYDFDLYEERTQKDVVKAMAGILSKWVDEDSEPLHFAAAVALSEMGDHGAAAIRKTRGISHIDRNMAVRALLVEALGKHRVEKDCDYFFSLLTHDSPEIVRSACNALAEFYEADQALRKRIFQQVLKVYGKAHDADAKKKGEDDIAHERLLRIEVPMNYTLDRMTGYDLQSVPEWREWWAKHQDGEW